MLENNKIDEKSLEKVNGGTGGAADQKREEFENAWAALGYDQKGLTGTELEDLFAQWQNAGFNPSARKFLETCKTI